MKSLIRGLLLAVLTFGLLPPAAATDKTIHVVTGFSLGPYVLRNGGGILSDIIKESLLLGGFEVRFHYMSNADALDAFKAKAYQAVTVVKPGMVEAHISEPVISFNNAFITLADSPQQITSLDDLEDLHLIAFSKATGFMGEHYREAITRTRKYEEVANQEEQIAALFNGQADVILADEIIFRFFHRRLLYKHLDDDRLHQQVRLHYQFAPNFYHIGFQDEAVQQAFDEGFVRLRESGRVDAIYRYYLELLKEY